MKYIESCVYITIIKHMHIMNRTLMNCPGLNRVLHEFANNLFSLDNIHIYALILNNLCMIKDSRFVTGYSREYYENMWMGPV